MDPSASGGGGDGGYGPGVLFGKGRGEDVWKEVTFPDGSRRTARVPYFLKDSVLPPPIPWHEAPRYLRTGEIPPGWTKPLLRKPLTPESDFVPLDFDRYKKQVESSGGYDVDYMTGLLQLGLISPVVDLQCCYKHYESYTLFAIEEHNKDEEKEDGKLELVSLLKATTQCSCHPRIFVTFEAKDGGSGNTKIYQARIDIHPPRRVLGEFREKPHQQQT